jgi:hypothetical protein
VVSKFIVTASEDEKPAKFLIVKARSLEQAIHNPSPSFQGRLIIELGRTIKLNQEPGRQTQTFRIISFYFESHIRDTLTGFGFGFSTWGSS